ncbi:PEGA domain-containing protein [Brumimicrobium oceani]|uniref:PEGA domain-containing protein n=1 Tax=Brumimicrobium oceani TaxID=2100725 RepID=A0A2U2XEK5_9FLAO|nr:PEGA domain-containing protein [Brumimicrobium oceani]PWH86177.1 hypothetical protein DIT68_06375 [Brumimicrobium oceani]
MKSRAKNLKGISILLAFAILASSCASTTLINSIPAGAKVYVNNEPVGTTPHAYTDTKITGSTNYIQLKKEGYETLRTTFTRSEEIDPGAIVGGIFLIVPFLWTMKYKPTRIYELQSLNKVEQINNTEKIEEPLKPKAETRSKAERLREFKQLLEEEIITQEEFEQEKKKILDEN